MTTTAGTIAGLLLLFVLVLYTFWPEKTAAGFGEKTRLEGLLERRQQLEENLREMEFDYGTGKYAQADYAVQHKLLELEAAELQAKIKRWQG